MNYSLSYFTVFVHACDLCLLLEYHLQLVKLAKRLKKEKVNVDIVNFGEEVSTN
jgi:hypothetical protein